MNQDEFESLVLSYVPAEGRASTLHVEYDADGDCLEFFLGNDNFYAQRVDQLLTLYVSRSTNRPIGGMLKGVVSLVRKFLEKAPGFAHEISGHSIEVEKLLTARLWSMEQDGARAESYKQLRTATAQKRVRAPLPEHAF